MINGFKIENQFKKKVIGVDEVGCGPWAGPVVAAACYFTNNNSKKINTKIFEDSKKLSLKKRKECYKHILELQKLSLINFSTGSANVKEIDSLNILRARLLAMKRAIIKLDYFGAIILVDGIQKPFLSEATFKSIVKGDNKSISIAASSIIAKIARDKIMQKLSYEFPEYGWESNMGYGTKKHSNAIKLFGINKHHRKTFKPIKKYYTE